MFGVFPLACSIPSHFRCHFSSLISASTAAVSFSNRSPLHCIVQCLNVAKKAATALSPNAVRRICVVHVANHHAQRLHTAKEVQLADVQGSQNNGDGITLGMGLLSSLEDA